MFRALAKVPVTTTSPSGATATTPYGADNLFRLHPADISAVLELAWDRRFDRAASKLGSPLHRSDLTRFEDTWIGRNLLTAPFPGTAVFSGGAAPRLQPSVQPLVTRLVNRRGNFVVWNHLIYAYMIENTRIREIFRRVVHEFLHGEKLGAPSTDTQHWLRTTEQLFYRDPVPLSATSVQSDIRLDGDATRRTAYQRMFAMDLNHGGPDNKPYNYVRAEAANKEFVSTFEELLRETWVGIINASNSSGAKATDDNKLRDVVKKLQDMLLARRINGNLSREEFTAVCMMSWFHLTLEADNAPVVRDLRAEAASPEQRLYKIAQQVGVPAHGLAGSYFDIADSISRILLLIESEFLVLFPNAIVGLYMPGTLLEQTMRTIITHWSIITGRDIKAGKIAPADAPRRPS